MLGISQHIGPWVGTNVAGLVLVLLGFAYPRLTRWLFVTLFAGAGVFNAFTALHAPESYVEGFAKLAVPAYRSFIEGPFAQHATAFVLSIALGQVLVAAMIAKGERWLARGAFGAVVFLVAISPLGVGSAFPATLFMALAMSVAAIQNGSFFESEPLHGEPVEAD